VNVNRRSRLADVCGAGDQGLLGYAEDLLELLREPRQIELAAKVTQGKRSITIDADTLARTLDTQGTETRKSRNHTARVGDISVWKLSGLDFNPDDIDRLVKDATEGAKSLVLDLRGNGGGFVKGLELLSGYFFDHDFSSFFGGCHNYTNSILSKITPSTLKSRRIAPSQPLTKSLTREFVRSSQTPKSM